MKKILAGFGLLMLAFIVLIMLVWFFPQMVINTKTVTWAVKKQSAIQFEPTFPNDFGIDVRNSRLVRQKIRIHASNFCIKTKDDSMRACFDVFDFSTALNFRRFSLMFDSIGPVNIVSSSIDYKSTQENEPKSKKKKSKTTYPEFSKNFQLEELLIVAPNISVNSGKSKMKANVDLQGKATDDQPYALTLKTRVDSNQDPKIIDVNLAASIVKSSNFFGSIQAHVGSDGKKPSVDLNSKFQGDLTKGVGSSDGSLRIVDLTSMVPLIDVHKFKIIKDEKLSVESDFKLELMVGHLNEPRKSALPPPKFATKFEGRAVAEQSGKQPVHFDIKINPSRQYGLVAQAKAKGQYNLKKSTLDLETLLLELKIDDFAETVRGLKNTQMAIPAPLNDLRGKIHLLIGSEKLEQVKKGHYLIPIDFGTDLTSTRQSLVVDAKGEAKIQPTPFDGELNLDVNLNDIAIQLPDFDPISKFPTVVGDSRFVTKKEKVKTKDVFKEEKNEASNFAMNINVDTPNKPIRILYKLFKPSAMFRFKTSIKNQTSDFKVTAEPFDVSYLKRTARLERLKITDDEKAQSIKLDGRFSIKKADYMIYVDIQQEAKKSYVTLFFEPPLSEDDIVSLILFNELANLDSTSNDSVQDTQAAMTKKTIGFLSFFVLASTPIKRQLRSTTQQYSARVKLPGGFTGTVGSDWENSQQVGLRRRLGGKFVISAGVGTDSEGDQRQETMSRMVSPILKVD
ncbi:MAG: hypothetical protein R2877_07290 [Bdellovibrionota bacterium]